MLVKYLGTTINEKNEHTPRAEFLENGLFRMTQPKFLNDKGSEAKFFPYFDKFSPADMAYARKCFFQFNTDLNPEEPSDEELINHYLKPIGRTYNLEEFPTLLGFTEYDSVESYNQAQREDLEKAVEGFNNFILEALSCHIGVFSLSKSANNELMWTHYTNEGKGLAVTFKEEHPFFKNFGLQDVSYKEEDRAFITYYRGTTRINGEYAKSFELDESMNLSEIYKLVYQDKNKYKELVDRLLYSKSNKWSYEEERRILCPLISCETKSKTTIEPNFDLKLPDNLLINLPSYPEICLKEIPFDAFSSVIFGYSVNEVQKQEIISKAQQNPLLKHLKFSQAKFDIFGDINIVDL
ncbi:DUF2971 domain-containing protein [Psychrobacter namhaensis]|jgi:hypothetical protein|uniref:DUF2971 domain-containing protein n=1 Tax=Psychrobacter namhaensis TaxID=292734 RepID=UPI0018DF19D8|nr:DUF2971 domain-containing protein [Psychrobacter namhaensis]